MVREKVRLVPQIEIQKELVAKEKLLWAGCPKQGLLFRHHDLYLIPFGVIWLGFAIFWEVIVVGHYLPEPSETADPLYPILGLPFLLIGIYFLIGRFVLDAKVRAQTVYGLTNERVIIPSGLFGRRIESQFISELSDLFLVEAKEGRGSVVLESEAEQNGKPALSFTGGSNIKQFELTENAKFIHRLIQTRC